MPFRSPVPSPIPASPWPSRTWRAIVLFLALATLVLHGFHPFAEDGGLYAAGVEHALDPSLFPHDTAFVTGPLRFSLFVPAVALLVRLTHLSLQAVLLLLDLLAAFCTLSAARAILRRCTPDSGAQLAGLALLAAGWTLPVAGTSLYLMDPYVTARTLAMPLSLSAIALALDPWTAPQLALPGPARFLCQPALRCATCLLLSAAFHPLMASYALLFVTAVRATVSKHPVRSWVLLASALLLGCLLLQTFAPTEASAEKLAVISRYYWFLSQWHWYERLGLLGPLIMLGLVICYARPQQNSSPSPFRTLSQAAILLCILSTLCALLFAHESSSHHAVARLQPLRAFLLVYAVMLLLLGATLYTVCIQAAARRDSRLRTTLRALPALMIIAMASGLSYAAHTLYPSSPHVELPWQVDRTPNLWVQAFLWARINTPRDALFALDARYVNTDGEDAQTFRAHSLRSALPDYSKDGGEASIHPALAPAWLAGAEAQKDLSTLPDTDRDRRLLPYGVTWMVLHTTAPTARPCPYRNATVKVCRLP